MPWGNQPTWQGKPLRTKGDMVTNYLWQTKFMGFSWILRRVLSETVNLVFALWFCRLKKCQEWWIMVLYHGHQRTGFFPQKCNPETLVISAPNNMCFPADFPSNSTGAAWSLVTWHSQGYKGVTKNHSCHSSTDQLFWIAQRADYFRYHPRFIRGIFNWERNDVQTLQLQTPSETVFGGDFVRSKHVLRWYLEH